MTKKIIILGTGGNGLDILELLTEINAARSDALYECIGFLDDAPDKWGKEFMGVRVLGGLDLAKQHEGCQFVNGIGSVNNYYKKEQIIARTGIDTGRFETLVHPTASVSRSARLGRGVVVLQHVTITNQVTLGDHVMVLPASVISHDDRIGDYVTIAGGVCISGNVTVGRSCYLGTNASIREGVTIGELALVGMGSVVLNDVPPETVVVGNPARVLERQARRGL